jgi:Flp pilus assembly protein TadG
MIAAKQSKTRRAATTLVEFAFIAVIFLMMLFGIMEYCYILYTYNIVENAAREGARYAIVNTSNATVISDTQTYVQSLMAGLDTKMTGYSCSVYQADSSGNNNNAGPTNAQFGQFVCVDVSLTYVPMTPGLLYLSSFTIRSRANMGCEAN